VKCPISELGATVKITNSNIIIKISHPNQWESDSAQENHTLPCNITLKINEFEKLRSIPSTRIKHKIRDNVMGYMLVVSMAGHIFVAIWHAMRQAMGLANTVHSAFVCHPILTRWSLVRVMCLMKEFALSRECDKLVEER